MFGDLIKKAEELKSKSLDLVEQLPVIELSEDECKSFENFVFKSLNAKCICNSSSFQVETSPQHWAVCSNQYLALAAIAYDFATCLKKYFDFFDTKIRSNENETNIVISLQRFFDKASKIDLDKIDEWLMSNQCNAYISQCDENPGDKASLCYFLAGIGTKKFGNDKGTLRATQDLFGAYILSIEPLTTAASGFLGSLVYALSSEPDYYSNILELFERAEKARNRKYLKIPCFDVEKDFHECSREEVLEKLAAELEEKKGEMGVCGIHYFGMMNAKIIKQLQISKELIVSKANISSSYVTELSKGCAIYEWGERKNYISDYRDLIVDKEITEDISLISKNVFSPSQIIYYGVPGCGKSHQVKEDLKAKGIPQDRTKRVVFHPDYCNADFVGQIMPETKKDGGVRYNFKAGPFAKILRVAYENPNLEYALIIEEINRGNAAAIFGDIFQLLDRKTRQEQTENLNGNSYGIGWSDYCVNNDYINAYFRGAYDGEIVDGPLPEKKLGNTTFNDNVDIRLPPNLSIYATMNTSDQNVFTLDNAFQRRWKMKQIPNTLDLSDSKEAAQYSLTIGDSGVKWGKFREEINNKIVDPDYTSNFSSLEDKRLGGWFVVPEKEGDTFISKENFADKVIKFLWDDAFKFNRAIFGDYEKKSLELVIEAFVGDVGFGVFEENFRKCLNVAESSADQQSDGQS